MKRITVLMACALTFSAMVAADACKTDKDCKASKVGRFCSADFAICTDCCEFVDKLVCPPACSWSKGKKECRNDAAAACKAAKAVPEPKAKTPPPTAAKAKAKPAPAPTPTPAEAKK